MSLIVYDCETRRSVLKPGEQRMAGIEYVDSWSDKAGMGIAVVGACLWPGTYRVFMEDNLAELQALTVDPRNVMVGWNCDAFDVPLLAAHGITIAHSYDLCLAVGAAAVAGRRVRLSDACQANGMAPKVEGVGALAPVLWQQKRVGQVIDYCLSDVQRTRDLLSLALQGKLRMPPSFTPIPVDTARLLSFM